MKVTSNYGSFTSDRLKGLDKDIFVQYGSGNIKQMDDGVLFIAYSKFKIDKAQNEWGKGTVQKEEVEALRQELVDVASEPFARNA